MESEFKGRQKEINKLYRLFDNTRLNQTNFITLTADTGIGKTRLVQEFYHYLSKYEDKGHYWPGLLNDTKHTMTIVPSFHTMDKSNPIQMPWLWLGIRCQNSDERNSDSRSDTALIQLRKQIGIHLDGIINSKFNKSLNLSVSKSVISMIANYAFPGGGPLLVELLGDVFFYADRGVGFADAISNFKKKWQFKKNSSQDQIEEVSNQEYKNLVEQTIEVFSILFKKNEKTQAQLPIIFVIDDAQWADQMTLELLEKLVTRGMDDNWPLLIIATCWESSMKEQLSLFYEGSNENPYFGSTLMQLKKLDHGKNIQEEKLEKLNDDLIIKVINDELPNISHEAKRVIATNCSGDLELMWEYINRTKNTPGFLKKDGTLAVPAEKLGFKSSKKKEIARERIQQFGFDICFLLAWGSAQGIKFSRGFLERCVKTFEDTFEVSIQSLIRTDSPYNITKIQETKLQEVAEFRRRIYFEVSREMLDDMPQKDDVILLLIDFYNETINSPQFNSLEFQEQIELFQDFRHLVIHHTEKNKYKEAIIKSGLALQEYYLQQGFFQESLNTGGDLLSDPQHLKDYDLKKVYMNLIETSYCLGDSTLEEKYINRYLKEFEHETKDPTILFHQSNYYLRYDFDRSLSLVKEAKEVIGDNNTFLNFRCHLQEMRLYFYKGDPANGFDVLGDIEKTFVTYLQENFHHRTYLDYNVALLLHNVDKNEQVVRRLKKSIEGYEQLNDKFNFLLASINLADGYFGANSIEQAEKEIVKIYEITKPVHWKNLHGVASLVYANILSRKGEMDNSLFFYEEGINVSNQIKFTWDEIYGKIWMELTNVKLGNFDSLEKLKELKKFCDDNEYGYLSELAATFLLLGSILLKANIEESESLFQNISKTNAGLYAQGLACLLLLNHFEGEEFVLKGNEMIKIALECEGIKGMPEVIECAVRKLNLRDRISTDLLPKYLSWSKTYLNDKQLEIFLN